MAVYPIMSVGKGGNTKHPIHSWNTEECISKDHEFYLTDELSGSGKRYRLHARNAHSTDDFLPYVVLCPGCGREMKCVGGPKTLNTLGLYECKRCLNY